MAAMSDAGSPISKRINVSRLPKDGMRLSIESTAPQRAALAESHGLLSVEHFSADLKAAPWRGDGVKVTGTLRAEVVQQCVVTLEPLAAGVETAVEGVFVPEGSPGAAPGQGERGEIVVHTDAPDLPEVFTGHFVDIGALAEEHFELALDPYPRKPGAQFDEPAPAIDERVSPFSGLSALKTDEETGK